MMARAEFLTNKHFKNRNIQRFHRLFHEASFMSFIWILPICLCIIGYHYDNPKLYTWACFFMTPFIGVFINIAFSYIIYTVIDKAIVSFFFRVPSLKLIRSIWADGLILIDPDGNPKMTYRISKYPALRYYRYRLPDAGDLDKITEYLENYSYPKDNYDRYRLSE